MSFFSFLLFWRLLAQDSCPEVVNVACWSKGREEKVTIRAGSRTRPLPPSLPASLPTLHGSFLWLIKADADHGAHLELIARLKLGMKWKIEPDMQKRTT